MEKERETLYFTCNSDKLIALLVEKKEIELIGIGSRFEDKFGGLHSEILKADNTYNWEITGEGDDGELEITSLSSDFEIRESHDLIILSKHLGGDIRGNYGDEYIYIKKNPDDEVCFYNLVVDHMYELREQNK